MVSLPQWGRAQSSSPASYTMILERYQRGDDKAVTALAALAEKDVETGERALHDAFESSAAGDTPVRAMMRVAVVVHTEAALAARRSNQSEWKWHLGIAQRYVEDLQSRKRDDPVARRWWLLTIAYMHGLRDYREAIARIARARHGGGDTPALLLALGVTHELAWAWEHEHDGRSELKGNLEQAAKAYASALAMNPWMVEARVRLGRVRALRGDSASAVRLLIEVQQPADIALVYLARVFEGNALEQQSSAAEAERRYEAAIELLPRAQTAYIALAHARHLRGARTEAADNVRATAADRDVDDAADPWLWYGLGFAWHTQGDVAALRALVRQ